MKNLLFIFAFIKIMLISAQSDSKNLEPAIKDFGKTHKVANPDLTLKTDKIYNVIFDVYTDAGQGESINPLINTVARFINMHTIIGVPLKNMNITLVVHGVAINNLLNQPTNPNLPLLKALHKANVDIYVCGQTMMSKKIDRSEFYKNVKVSLSALTALVEYQSRGYQIINFN